MTALRPERETATGEPVDPLTDPFPEVLAGGHSSPWFRAEQQYGDPVPGHPAAEPYARPQPSGHPSPDAAHAYGAEPAYTEQAPYGAQGGYAPPDHPPAHTETYGTPEPASQPREAAAPYLPVPEAPPRDDETVALHVADPARIDEDDDRDQDRPPSARGAEGGRAARRKAAKRNARPGGGRRAGTGRRRAGAPPADGPARGEGDAGAGAQPPERPRTRVEARRAERARKPSAATVASRAVGELFITIGVLMLLFVTYQLWWTNVRAQQQADGAASSLQQDWERGERKPGVFEAGQGFAIIHIPKLDVVVPVASGIDKQRVLDRGMAGHYAEGALKTALPEAKKGNFAVAGHRNTHGEPFRYINRLTPGDPIVVETQDTYYVYEMASILPQTPPSNTAVIDPVPAGSGFTEPGRYITLTTCTPEFTSTYRMIVWGKMVEERPRSEGKPDALVD